MTDLRETSAVLALLRRHDTAWNAVADLVEEAGSAVSVLEAAAAREELTLLRQDGPDVDAELAAIAGEIEAWRSEGMELVTVLDEGYPENLRTVHDRPPFLFVKGRLNAADSRSVAVVGTRSASDRGRDQAADAARRLVASGYVVVSGLAAGVDAAAQRAALQAGGRTVGVIGTGLRRSYPKENAGLQRELAEHHAVVSQFWPDQPPGRHTFPMRNAVMSGFALATLVIEASRTSGAKMQARLALEHGRPIFLLRTLLEHRWAQEYAERAGAYVVDTADEVVGHLDRIYAYDVALTS